MKPIRVLVDSLADAGLTNAQMANAREIVRRLDPSRFAVTMFVSGDPDPQIAACPNIRLVQLPARLKTIRVLREFVLGDQDLIFYLKASPASRWYLARRWRRPCPTIGTVESRSDLRNEPTIAPEAVRLWEQTVLRCQYLFSNSQAVRKSLLAEYGLESEVVPTGVDTRFFSPGDMPKNPRPRVLFVGSLRPFKQPQVVVDAAAKFPHAEFVIAGEGISANELAERARKENLANVEFLGHLQPIELLNEYRKADVFLFPSSWEGSPKVLLEAAACGLPVIARNNYEPESVFHGKTGYLVTSDEELFARLAELLAQPDQRLAMGQAGRKHAAQFDWDGITRRWEQVFLSITVQSAKGAA